MKRIFAVSLIASVLGIFTACGSNKSANPSKLADTSTADPIEFDGVDADSVYTALASMGVVDTDRLIGATNLRVTSLRCERPLYDFHSPVNCRFTAINATTGAAETLTKTGKDAATILDVLSLHGASVNGGINASAVAAKSLICSMPVIPNPTARCVLETL